MRINQGDEVIIITKVPTKKIVLDVADTTVLVEQYNYEKNGELSTSCRILSYPIDCVIGVGTSLFKGVEL